MSHFTPTTVLAIASVLAMPSFGVAKIKQAAQVFDPNPIVQPASEDGQKAIANLQLPEGLDVSLVAAEPLFANPVAFTIDEQGRIFVAETYRINDSVLDIRGYRAMLEEDMAARTIEDRVEIIDTLFEKPENFAIQSEIVRMLEDTDGDGAMDASSIYADGFNSKLDGIISGLLARNGKVWVANIPSLTQLEGIDENGKAEKQTDLLTGFGTRFGFVGHDLHGLAWGPDGKLYFSIGDRGSNVVSQEGKRFAYPDEGTIFRCNPDGSDYEVVAFGLRNPQELIFDDFGNLFTGDNDCDNGDRERLVHLVEGGDSGWRVGHQHAPLGKAGMWMLEDLWKPRFEGQAAYILPPVANTADGPSGVAYYPGTGLGDEYKGHIFICHFKGSLTSSGIDTYTVTPDGASFSLGEQKPFLKRALPTDVSFGYDGRLYYSDWVTGWKKTGKGRMYAIESPSAAKDPRVEEVKNLFKNGFQNLTAKKLQSLLGHDDQRVRLEAQFTLAERGTESISVFNTVALDQSSPLLARLHATWGLGQLGEDRSAQKSIRKLLKDEEDEVRAQAAKLIGDLKIKAETKRLVSYLKDSSARVQFFAAQSLGKIGNRSTANALVNLIRRNNDADLYLRHAAIMGLLGTNNSSVIDKAAKDESKAVRMAALLVYRRQGSAKVSTFLSDSEPELILEAARAINGANIEDAYPALAAIIDTPLARENELLGLRVLNAHFRVGQAANAQALANFALDASVSEKLRIEALQHFVDWPTPPLRDRIVGLWRPLEDRSSEDAIAAFKPVVVPLMQQPSGDIQAAVIKAISSLNMIEASDDLYAIVSNPLAPLPARIAALATLDDFNDSRLGELTQLASQSTETELRQAALPIVARLSPEKATPVLETFIASGSVAEKRNAFKALQKMDHPSAGDLLAKSIDLLETKKIPAAAQLELLDAAKASSSESVKEKLAARNARLASSGNPIAPYEYAIAGGDKREGKRVFQQHPAMACMRCHIINGEGGEAGPDLTGLAINNTPKYILEAIIKPNATIAPGFETAVITKTDGSSITGTVLERGETSLKLKLPDSTQTEIPNSDVAASVSLPSSMPEVFQTLLTPHELRDLMAYLKTLKGGPGEAESH